MEETKKPRSYRAIAWRVVSLVLAMWLLFMGVLTWAVAQDFYRQLYDASWEHVCRMVHRNGSGEETPGSLEVSMIDSLGSPYYFLDAEPLLPFVLPQEPDSYSSDDWIWGKWDLLYGCEAAVIFYDENGEILMKSGNYLTFSYTAEENWAVKDVTAQGQGYVDLDAVEGGAEALRNLIDDYPTGAFSLSLFVDVMRLTGWWDGNRFCPVAIDRGSYYDPYGSTSLDALSRMDARGNVEWESLVATDPEPGQALTTIYAWDLDGIRCDYEPVSVNGEHFESLTELLVRSQDPSVSYARENLLDSVILWRLQREDDYGQYTYAMAVRCWPLGYAALRLIPTYLVTLAAVALFLHLILRKLRHSLTDPLERLISRAVWNDPVTPSAAWKEPFALEALTAGFQQQISALKTQNQQLRTALDYANSAEENRRQLVSSLTHELKTPLAVIHSYAEGLQAGIAEEKKDRYLSVILEEAERMDAMVLEMLDLSRLEAGKVRLAADTFSLLALAQSTAEKLAPAMDAKELTLSFGFSEDCLLTADEGRITQVITNLMTNAIKYTPPGGAIWLRIFANQGNAHFYIENTAPHMAPEELEKLFESFYRADPARTEAGTGLGLAISRSIIELHRGVITAKNTYVNGAPCIEFHFTIPLT